MQDQHHSQQVAHGTEEHHEGHEKKSVLKKVKAKAKKIKDTITKHGHHDDHEHGHGHEHQHIPDDHDLDEEDDEDLQDPEIHGAPIYDSGVVRNVTPSSGQGVNFGGTTIMGEEHHHHHHHHEPIVVVVSPATENVKVNLEEDPHAPGNRFHSNAPSNYQTKVTDPIGTGAAEIDITPIQKSLERMTDHNDPIPNQQPKTLPTISETQSPSLGIHNQYSPQLSTATKTPYPSSTITNDQNLPQLSPEIKTQYPKNHDQNLSHFSNLTKPQHPFATSHEPQHHFATSHDQHLPQYSTATKTTSNLLPTEPKPQHSYVTSHDTPFSGGIPPSAGSHDQFKPDLLPTESKPQHSFASSHDTYLPTSYGATESIYPFVGSHAATETRPQHQSATSLPYHSTAMKTQYPSAGSHNQFTPEFSTNKRNIIAEEQPQLHHESMENSLNQSNNSYTDKIYSATSAIADKATAAKDAVASKLGYREGGDEAQSNQNQSSYTDKIYSATSAVTDKAAGAKDMVASKLGFGETQPNQSSYTSAVADKSAVAKDMVASKLGYNETPSNQSSYTDKISSATSAVVHKAANAKNAVASKLGYGETTQSNQNQNQNQSSYTDKISSATSAVADKAADAKNAVALKLGYGVETPSNQNQSSYTEKISSATSAIADKAASAKNTVASTLGLGSKGETEKEKMRDSKVTSYEEKSNRDKNGSSEISPAEYGKRIAASLTEKLAPVTGVGSERGSGCVEQDKGVSMKEYISEKLRPGEDDKALSDSISESLYKRIADESVNEVYNDDIDEGRKMRNEPVRGKVTESEEVKKRLGGWDEKREGDYGKGVVDKVKDVVGSWFGSGEENQSTQGIGDLARNTGKEVEKDHDIKGERRLHESVN